MKARLLKILRKQASNFLELRDYGARYSNMPGKLDMYSSEEIIKNSWPTATILDIF